MSSNPPRIAALILAALAAAGCHSREGTTAHEPMLKRAPAAERAPGEYIVTLKPGAGADFLREHYASYQVREVVDMGGNMFLIKLARDPGPDEILRRGIRSGKVQAVQQNFIYRATP